MNGFSRGDRNPPLSLIRLSAATSEHSPKTWRRRQAVKRPRGTAVVVDPKDRNHLSNVRMHELVEPELQGSRVVEIIPGRPPCSPPSGEPYACFSSPPGAMPYCRIASSSVSLWKCSQTTRRQVDLIILPLTSLPLVGFWKLIPTFGGCIATKAKCFLKGDKNEVVEVCAADARGTFKVWVWGGCG